jgi:aminodeoxychorismate lyase
MKVVVNGQWVSGADAVVSVFDRGFLYGDGLFETLRVYRGRPFRWASHLDRLRRGAELLGIPLPAEAALLRRWADQLVEAHNRPDAVLRITLSRGVGSRGYSPRGAGPPSLVLSLHALPPELDPGPPPARRLLVSSYRLPADSRLAALKGASRLLHVLALAEAEAQGADDALLLNADGEVAEAGSSNMFWVEGDVVCTPPLASGALDGVTRRLVLELSAACGLAARERPVTPDQLRPAQAIFLTQSVYEIVPVLSLDHRPVSQSPVVDVIRAAYRETVRRETAAELPPA